MQPARHMALLPQSSLADDAAPGHPCRPGQGLHCVGQSCAGSMLAIWRQPGLRKQVWVLRPRL